MNWSAGWCLLVGAALFGCGGGGSDSGSADGAGAAACNYTQTVATPGAPTTATYCVESIGLTAAQVSATRSVCERHQSLADGGIDLTGVFVDGLCPRNGTAGGCRLANSGKYAQVIWYPGGTFTVQDVQTSCASEGGTFVAS